MSEWLWAAYDHGCEQCWQRYNGNPRQEPCYQHKGKVDSSPLLDLEVYVRRPGVVTQRDVATELMALWESVEKMAVGGNRSADGDVPLPTEQFAVERARLWNILNGYADRLRGFMPGE